MKLSRAIRRRSGIVVPLSAIRGDASPGCGEFPDLARVADLAAAWGFDLVQLLPVNDSGFQNSPYSGLSAFALHPIYIRIGDIPEISAEETTRSGDRLLSEAKRAEFRARAEALVALFRNEERVPHESLLKEKLELLRDIWDALSSGSDKATPFRSDELDAWIEANPWVQSYAAFVALKSQNNESPWWEWPRFQNPTDSDIEALWRDRALGKDLRFWSWLQMRAAGQFRMAAEYLSGKGIALMGDIPILMNKDSADVWARRHVFRLDLAAGAPPDMYASMGQNWGFPVYDWEALGRENYSFWTERLIEADKYYSCYRIDHVLGFFRIWSLSDRERTGILGRFIPDVPITRDELASLGFSPERIRWLSLPHVPIWRLVQAAGESAARGAASAALDRIGNEDLFLFKESIHGEKDIEALPSISPAARDCLLTAWRDRALFEYESGLLVSTWSHRSSTCWSTLSYQEQEKLESLISRKAIEAESLWAATGKLLLGALTKAVPMLPCAEDLGSVPDCVPRVLEDLGILGLRVFRWTKNWREVGQPYIPIDVYPELSVACPSVHDSTSLRDWWEAEADRGSTWAFAAASLKKDLGECPDHLTCEQVETLLELIARSASRFAVYPIQDLLAMSEELRPVEAKSERINVPGTVGAGNWSYRIPFSLDVILAEKKLAARARALAKARNLSKSADGKGRVLA
jgi:4-alpha-glucanotransferase